MIICRDGPMAFYEPCPVVLSLVCSGLDVAHGGMRVSFHRLVRDWSFVLNGWLCEDSGKISSFTEVDSGDVIACMTSYGICTSGGSMTARKGIYFSGKHVTGRSQ